MNRFDEQLKNLYLGILSNYPDIDGKKNAHLQYGFKAKEFRTLREKYSLERIAGDGTAFERAKRLLHYFSPRLTHSSWYDNHVECNALKLLEYSFEKPESGINCLNKSKILAECCLAIGIYARRVFISPFSPFDFDSHVVCEIYDDAFDKWIMLDPTTDGYFIDENKMPLSMAEIREHFASLRFTTFVSSTTRRFDLERLATKNAGINWYILKNCFLISFEPYNGFGEKPGSVHLIPKNYSVLENEKRNYQFRLANMPEEYKHLLGAQEDYISKYGHKTEPVACRVQSVYQNPHEKGHALP